MLSELLLPALIYAAPLSITLFLFGDRPGFRLRAIDVMFVVWCLAFYPLFWQLFYPIAQRIPPHGTPAMGTPGSAFDNWSQVLVAPGMQGLLTGVFLFYLFRSIWILVAAVVVTFFACSMLMSLDYSGVFPSAIAWNLLVCASITIRQLTREKSPIQGVCARCNYDLSGGPHEVCPECGASVRAS